MLEHPRFRYREHGDYVEPAADREREFFSLAEIAGLLRRYAWTIVGCIAIGLVLALAYLATARPVYTARAQIIIDPQSSELLRQQTGQTDVSLDTAAVESQIAVLRSEKIAIAVLADLGDRGEFNVVPPPSLVARVKMAVGGFATALLQKLHLKPLPPAPDPVAAAQALANAKRQYAIDAFEASLDVRRVGLSYAMDIFFSAHDPSAAALAANATADAYIRDQVEARAQAARAGGVWLESRIAQLRDQMDAALRAVQEYKAAHGLVDTGDHGLLADQQVAQLNSELIAARAKTAEAQARLDRIRAILSADLPDAGVAEMLGNVTITNLRGRYLDAAAKLADAETRYGSDEPPVVGLKREMAADVAAIHAELGRIGATYQSDYDIAKGREAKLTADLARLIAIQTDTKRAAITVAQLATTAQTYQRIYESFLQAYTESVQRQSFPVSDARVITQASTPIAKSRPRTGLILTFALLLGALAGIGIAIVRQGLDRSLRTAAQIRDEVGLDCLGLLPAIAPSGGGRRRRAVVAAPFDEVLIRPYSSFSDSLKTVRTAVAIAGDVTLLGVTSALHGEGKSTVAANLARLMAGGGAKVLLIDADIRSAALTAALAPAASAGLLEAIAGARPVASLIVADPTSKLDVLPMVGHGGIAAGDLLASKRLRALFETLRGSYDAIVVDLPPAMDALGLVASLDAVVMAVEWGKTPANVLMEALHALRTAQARLLGAVVTKVARPSGYFARKRPTPAVTLAA
ncbi:MAG TPA: polysaccharide biosynthesis tyrosine autokinase [Hyphomicrobiales bacterium]|nr:polysaccharide biosynthesis tyrosine autokinase [Hyphomicrobiales bacterium]